MKAQLEQLPPVLLPLGRIEITTFSKVQFFDNFVQKRITFSHATWPHSRCKLMEGIYAASKDCPFLIHAQEPPHASQNGKEYVVDLEPVGQPVLSKYFDHRPQSLQALKNSIRCATCNDCRLFCHGWYCTHAGSAMKRCRGKSWLMATTVVHSTFGINDAYISLCLCRCILHALEVLHQAGFAHTDLRWENIIQHAGQWVLIDLEFACVLNSLSFTPEGESLSFSLACPYICLFACLQSKDSKTFLQPVPCICMMQLCSQKYQKA